MIANAGRYGSVSALSSAYGISRQTLYSWEKKGQQALQESFRPKEGPKEEEQRIERAILMLFTEGHSSYRGIQVCLQVLLGLHVSMGKISGILQQAGKRAQEWLVHQMPQGKRSLALDEQYGSERGKAYLNIVDVHSGLVLASVPPVAVDGESWTILLWLMQEQGLEWQTIVCDGGRAIQDGVENVSPHQVYQRDVWHVLHECQKVQRRLDRKVEELQRQTTTVKRQAARVAAGKKPRGVNPKTDVQAQEALTSQAEYVADSLRYLSSELKRLLSVVVRVSIPQQSLLSSQQRHEELDTLLDLLAELSEVAPAIMNNEVKGIFRHMKFALPHLLGFAASLDGVQEKALAEIGPEAVHLIAWAWLHRDVLGQRSQIAVTDFPQQWRESASVLLSAWDQAVRASSCVENWHSVLRPFLAVHHSLSAGMLALLAVWHNHRVAPRGLHEGQSPLQRSGIQGRAIDWLVTLGYPPAPPTPLIALKRAPGVLAA